MAESKKNYTIGLDIGTSSVGWAVIDEDFNLVQGKKKIKTNVGKDGKICPDGKYMTKKSRTNLWGVRLFDEAETAEDRRLKRGMRRRIARRRKRLEYLREIFESEISTIDPYLFLRLDQSFLKNEDRDRSVKAQFPIFPTAGEEKAYHQKFPTIYHLRKGLAESNEKQDIRYVFLALNHIFKNRGHFVNQDLGDNGYGDFSRIEVKPEFMMFIEKYNELFDDGEVDISKYDEKVEELFKKHNDEAAKQIGEIFEDSRTGTLYQFVKLMFGMKPNFKTIFGLDEDAKLQFSDEKYEEELDKILTNHGDFAELFELAKNVNGAIFLSDILLIKKKEYRNSPTKLSAGMVERYEEHKEDLHNLKDLLRKYDSKEYDDFFYNFEKVKENNREVIEANYVGYVGLPKSNYRESLVERGKLRSESGRKPFEQKYASEERFHKYTKGVLENLKNLEEADELLRQNFLKKIKQGDFLRKQRTFDNGSIPYQLQLHELKAIIDNQKAVNVTLKQFFESDFAQDKSITNEEAIYKIFKFRIPYYVGPLRDRELLSDTKQKSPWLVKSSKKNIRPWNFEDVVSSEKSAEEFIKRMQKDDTYLYREKTLPKNSLTYQKYEVLNELTRVRLDGELIDPETRQKIFNQLFKTQRKISKSSFKKFLKKKLRTTVIEISGLGENSENENSFNSQYSTYQDLRDLNKSKGLGIPVEILDDESQLPMLEEIIKVLTIMPEDREMKLTVLRSIPGIDILDNEIIKELAKKKFSGYGRLSGKLLGLGKNALKSSTSVDGLGEKWTIIDFLEKDKFNRNFQALITDVNLTFKYQIDKFYQPEKLLELDDSVRELAGSPAIKRGILQALRIVREIKNYIGYSPSDIVIEMARENQTTQKGKVKSKTRLKVLQEILNAQWREATNEELASEKLFLYYLQDGKDAYTGKRIKFPLSENDVDHIIPRNFVKDDSISNKVLTSSKMNRGKSSDVPSKEVAEEMKDTWKVWKEQKRITKRKYNNLMKALDGGLSEKDKEGFIARQIVETRQITKHVARILNDYFRDEETRIITIKSAIASQLRKSLCLYKVREVNDYHHAHDAYLNAVAAQELLTLFPHLDGKFVYGQIDKSTWFKDTEKATKEKNIWMNLSRSVAKQINQSGKGEIISRILQNKTVDKNGVIHNISPLITYKLSDRSSNEKGRELYKQTIAQSGGKGSNPISTKFHGKNKNIKLDVGKYGGYLEQKEAFITIENGKLKSIKRTQAEDFKASTIKIFRNQIYKNDKIYRTVSSLAESGKWNQLKLTQEQINYIYGLQTWDKVIKYVKNTSDSKEDQSYYGRDLVKELEEVNKKIMEDTEQEILEFIFKNELGKEKDILRPEKFVFYRQKLEYFLALLNIASRGTTSENSYNEYEKVVDEETGDEHFLPKKDKNGKNITKKINKRIRFGKKVGEIKRNKTLLIHQSITGLYETREKLL